jgi:adenosylcobinamide-GDP ribazoletransferase
MPAAVALLTRVPVRVRASAASGHASPWAAAWFPVVGAVVGAAASGVWWMASPLGGLPAAVLAVATSILLTGALHEDGLADTADALGGARNREAIFEILKDSRVGTYGAAALVLSILLRVALLDTLGPSVPAALALTHMLARLGPVWLLVLLPYVTPAHLAKTSGVAQARWTRGAVATLLAAMIASALVLTGALDLRMVITASVAALGCTTALGAYFRARAGGVTGDFLGATEQTGECTVLLVLAGLSTTR